MKKSIIVLLMLIVAVSLFVGCKNEPEAKTYKVGDTGPAGGIIFYVNPNASTDGWTYLEAAPADLETKYKWGASGSYNTEVGVGKGNSNTTKLMTQTTEEITFPAARACYDYEYTNPETGVKYDDWFLPSKDELAEMYEKKDEIGNFCSDNDSYYCSSSEDSSGMMWQQKFNNGYQSHYYRSHEIYYVRPIRAF